MTFLNRNLPLTSSVSRAWKSSMTEATTSDQQSSRPTKKSTTTDQPSQDPSHLLPSHTVSRPPAISTYTRGKGCQHRLNSDSVPYTTTRISKRLKTLPIKRLIDYSIIPKDQCKLMWYCNKNAVPMCFSDKCIKSVSSNFLTFLKG